MHKCPYHCIRQCCEHGRRHEPCPMGYEPLADLPDIAIDFVRRLFEPSNIVRRRHDGTLWTAKGDCAFPVLGWNFCRVHRRTIRCVVDTSERWITYDSNDFDVIKSQR